MPRSVRAARSDAPTSPIEGARTTGHVCVEVPLGRRGLRIRRRRAARSAKVGWLSGPTGSALLWLRTAHSQHPERGQDVNHEKGRQLCAALVLFCMAVFDGYLTFTYLGVDRGVVRRFLVVVVLSGLLAAACGEPGALEEAAKSSTSTVLTSTSTSTAPPTTSSDIPVEVTELLDQLDEAWSPECDEAATEAGRLRVRMVVEWAPSYEQALGSFGGIADDEVNDIAAFLESECPEAGSVIRFVDVVDDEFPRGDMNAALALSPMLEGSLLRLGWEIGVPMAERLAPETAADAPEPPEWASTIPATCSELGVSLRDYYTRYVESLNDLSPVASFDWDATATGQESLHEAAFAPLNSLTESDCDTATALQFALEGAAQADAISFAAEAARWGLISNIRDYLFNETGSDTAVILSPICGDASTYMFTVTNEGTADALDVMVEATGTVGSGEDTTFRWSQDSLAPGESVTVESTIDRDQQFQSFLSWIDGHGVTHSQSAGIGCFNEIVPVPDS